ncbi:hypothetical protein [Sphingomonas abaci]|uniref:Uncharacterized protein n=1 Tax=Sphingomonas abaci TaxID=237611 RepID=A0A7W7AGQ9_9SPHN|nr:hypothetical protein [Sphingomonas abaci]MBB4616748.1 hypothetical protein [Sphingomonas abaci]
MTEAPGHRGYYLRSALWKAAGGSAGGSYSPRTGARTLHLGQDHTSPLAEMVALHENFHWALNGSTTFGVGMVLAGALDQAGEPGMDALIERMIEASVETHETYATLSGIYAASLSIYDRSLLDEYPDYQGYYDRMAGLLDLENAPFISSVCVAAAARVAMQTDLLDRWAAIPCADWATTVWDEAETPDARFAHVTSPIALAAAQQALRQAIVSASPAIQSLARGGLSRDDRIRAVGAAPLPEQEALQGLAFQAIAEACFPPGLGRPQWLAQRAAAAKASQQVVDHAGPRLRIKLLTSENLDQDFDATFMSAREERLIISSSKLPAVLHEAGVETEVRPSWFVVEGYDFGPHVQLVAIPFDKLPALYALKDPLSDRPPEDTLTVLRRFVETPSLPVPGFVHMLELASPSELPLQLESAKPARIFVMASASACMNPQWMDDWLLPLRRRGAAVAMLIDIDPFDFIPFWAKRFRQQMVRIRLDRGDHDLPDNMGFLAFVGSDDPDFMLFAPCSESFARSFIMMIERGNYNIDPDGSLSDAQDHLVQLAVGHIMREEGKFGFSHWWRNQ